MIISQKCTCSFFLALAEINNCDIIKEHKHLRLQKIRMITPIYTAISNM